VAGRPGVHAPRAQSVRQSRFSTAGGLTERLPSGCRQATPPRTGSKTVAPEELCYTRELRRGVLLQWHQSFPSGPGPGRRMPGSANAALREGRQGAVRAR
jgi:hypothetical protein